MRKLAGILAILVISAILFIALNVSDASVKQPIQYNHKKHIDAGLTCLDCHTNAEEGAKATIPTLDNCMECHEEAITESKEEETLRNLAANGIVYPWRQITSLKEDVFFSHRRHVKLVGMDCSQCHGKMEEMEKPPQKVPIKMSMKFCINCHKKTKADTDCIACHR